MYAYDFSVTMHSGPAGGNRQNPTFASLMQKLKLSYVLIKTLKGFGIKIKNKKFLLLEKISSIHLFFNLWWILLSKKTKTLKKSWMDPLGKGSVNDQTLDLTYIFGQFCQNLCPRGPSMILFKVLVFLLSKIHQKLKNWWILEIFSNNKKFLFLIFMPNPFRVFISTYESFNFLH